ncbi:MAG: LPD11 domain-containing protein [Oscillospiraceae bacterium]|nr:LPD11 domain-containing protein [Oscillospiraceae bacterium]
MKIVAEFSKQKPLEDRAAFLKALYHGGNGLITENGKISAWYGEDGIHIARGDTARYLPSAQVISWADAAERTEKLLDNGAFATNLEVTEAYRNERQRIATEVWNLYHDLADEAKSLGHLSCLSSIRSTNYPEETERLTNDLLNPEFRERLLAEYKVFLDAHHENRELLRFHYHRPQALLTRLEELSLPRKEYHSDMAMLPETGKFITEDEIADSLANGSSFEGGKSRIYAFFQAQHSPKECADFLKEEYGTGGRSHAVSKESGSFEEHGSKGIVLKKSGCAEIQMNWNKVVSRISELIWQDRYFTPDEQALYDKTLAQDAARNIAYDSYNAIKEAHPDDMVLYQVGDFFEMYGEDARQAELLLDLNLTSRNIPDVGRVTMCGIPAHSLEQYVEKLRDKYDVTIAATQEDSNERRIYTLPSIDHKAENAINAYGAEFGADGTSVFRDPAAEQPHQPTVRELFDRYKLAVGNALSKDTAFVNACRNSDRQNAYLEGAVAIRRIVTASDNLQLVRLYFDMPAFHNRLHQELLEELYPTLATTVAPSPYKVTQEDIDDALQKWNGNPQSKQAVVRYMEQHGREKDTALWLAKEYGAGDTSQPLQISVGNSEPVILSWSKVQRRLAQLIHEDHFFTEQEKPTLEQNPDYRLLDRLRADCEYFLGAGNRADKHLWAGNVRAQIAKMRELYDTLPEKPEWLTKETIDDYAERMAPPYQVVAYHHFENGFDDKLDYQTLAEAETAAQGYVDGIMESDGFAYDGAAIYDRQTRKYLRIYGNYPDERAHAETAGRDLVEEPAVSTESTIAPANRFHVVSLDQGFYIRYAIWDDKTDGYYVDTDGVTEEFTSEWQAEEYRLKLQNQALMEQAKGLISDFCQSEYSSEADFSDPAKIGIAYTTITDDEIPVQVNIDLVNFRLERYLNGEHLETRQYGSLQALIANELEILDFSDLTHVSDEDIEQYRWHKGEEATEKAPETVESAPSTQKGNLSYSVGDTVYLDNKPFEITEVGLFDVHLRDPSQTYPIFRVEGKELLPALLRRDERNAHLFAAEVSNQPQPVTKPVVFYPADKTHLPYDIVIQTLHIPEPEHDPPAEEPAEPESPAMSEEEMLILEHEGQAALSEMGEFVPDPDGAISQTEPDEPPAHSPAVSIPIDGQWQDFPSAAAAEQAAYADFKAASHRNAQNFRITDDNLGAGGAKAKYQANINAIRLLKHLEAEGLQASPEQQEILSRYVGWGGLPDAFDESKQNWAAEFRELRELLTPEEYTAARASTLNAHYTSPTVIQAIYEAVGNMGFQTGNILEPSMGVGNFFGMLPENMRGSRLYGVELDSITGRIAQQLYPKANITIAGFETTDRRDFFDLAVGNVPFGQYKVNDPAYNKLGFNIHNYFFAKALDQVRPGGVVAFVTSRYTMDSQNPSVRKHLAQRADLLGAIRLPNTAFKANAGTEVVSDILFLQRRDRVMDIEPDWVHLGQTEDGYAINSYFLDHPEMVMGKNSSESTAHGMDYTVEPLEDISLADQLHEAVRHIHGTYQEAELPDLGEGETIQNTIPADPDVKNFSYTLVDGEIYFRENSIMVRPELNNTAKERVKGMIGLKTCVRQLIDLQMDEFSPENSIQQKQAELNTLYDSFTEKYGILNSRGNRLAFSDDSAYYLLCALEILDDDGNFQGKADMFSKRTIQPHKVVTSVDTAVEALTISIGERACVDLGYMSSLSGKPTDALATDLKGIIFHDPKLGTLEDLTGWVTADEYLSGNVRQKLKDAETAAAENPMYRSNVDALRAAQPKDLEASEIEVRLGATWIDKAYIQQFMYELLDTPYYLRRSIHVEYSPYTAAWNISNKRNISSNDVAAWNTYGTDYVSAYEILEDSLNLRDVRVYDTVEDEHGKPKRVLNGKQTTLAQQKQQLVRDAFKDWIWADPTRRQTLVEQYNREMNSIRPREYDGSHIVFAGMNPEIRLREHQRNAIAHVLYGGNTLLAHEVGAGKTFEMVGAAMEAKRLGLCRKSLFVVPNHLTEQWASEFLRLYPSANILVTKQKDFETQNRKKFCARIATGDYDAVIIGHSQFEKIPISQERQEALLKKQIEEISTGIWELKANRAERFTVKQMERAKRSLEGRLEKLQAEHKKDDVVTFEELGIDRLFVDEAHSYKNLFLYTKMQNVAGLSTSDAQKSSDMFAKCRYMDELTGGRGVIFATGTPVSNSMTELYTMQRYLQYDRLQEMGMVHFDCWASRFGETVTALELAPEGKGYRPRTRFSRFFNLPELMNIFREVADIKTANQLHLPVPEVEYHNVAAKPSEVQQKLVQELSERAALIHSGSVSPDVDNMLKITSDGRKLGLDQRIINPAFPDDPESKVNLCVENILQMWQDGEADKLTQLVFCDVSTPQAAVKAKSTVLDPLGGIAKPFTVYEDIRSKLIAQGIPPEQIAFIHDANSEAKKKELFGKVRSGQVRVLLGSTAKMGAGTNVQDRLVAIHDLDCPWRPGDLAQRKGRIERQGNLNEKVHVFRYVTEGTFDAYLWQTVENKQKFISQIMSSKNPVRSCEDVDEVALSFAEIKALCAGDPRIKERMDLDVDVARLKIMKADYKTKQYRLEDSLIHSFPAEIAKTKEQIEALKADMQTLSEHPHLEGGFAGMTVLSDTLLERENAGAALIEAAKQATGLDPVEIGTYRGFTMSVTLENFGKKYVLTMQGKLRHPAELGSDTRGNLIRLDNALSQMPLRLQALQTHLEETYHQQAAAKAEVGKPWPYEQELQNKTARLIFLDAELNLDAGGQSEPVIAKSSRPSILSRLKSAPPQSKNPKPKKHHEEVR